MERLSFALYDYPDMVRDSMTLLEDRGLKRNKRREPGQITIEKYW